MEPILAPAGGEGQTFVDGSRPDRREVERDRRGLVAAAAGLLGQVNLCARIAELRWVDRNPGTAAANNLSALQLIDGEVNTLVVEQGERVCETLAVLFFAFQRAFIQGIAGTGIKE